MKVQFRVHGPYRHRKHWRLDVFENGERYKLSYPTYAEALTAAAQLARDGSGNSEPDPNYRRLESVG